MEAAPDVIAENARDAGKKEHGADDANGLLRLQPQLSHALAIRFSKTAVTVEKLANVIKRKKSRPHTRPPGMSRKILGSVIK